MADISGVNFIGFTDSELFEMLRKAGEHLGATTITISGSAGDVSGSEQITGNPREIIALIKQELYHRSPDAYPEWAAEGRNVTVAVFRAS